MKSKDYPSHNPSKETHSYPDVEEEILESGLPVTPDETSPEFDGSPKEEQR